jgi:hypothetical protein
MIPYIARPPEAQVQHWTETQNLRACCQSTVGVVGASVYGGASHCD